MKKLSVIVLMLVSAFSVTQLFGQNKKSQTQMFEIKEKLCPAQITQVDPDANYMKRARKTYFSNTCQRQRAYNIYLPVGYSAAKKYPVVYFMHGIFGDENSMTDPKNKLQEITGNLQALGMAEEFILVLPNIFAAWQDNQRPAFSPDAVAPYDNFINELVNDLMPEIEKNYSVKTGRENTAIMGFSMGGRETLYIGLQRPDLFGYVCAISPAPGLVPQKDWAMNHVGQIPAEEAKFKDGDELPFVFMITCGTKDSVVGQFPKAYHELFEKNGVAHTWWEVPNADHNDVAIRSGYYNFIQRIFK